MIRFAVNFPPSRPSVVGKDHFHFAIEGNNILLAGSRHLELDKQVCRDLLTALASLEATFLTGCGKGVDASFREALNELDFHDRAFIGCSFKTKAMSMSLPARKVVPDGLPASVALARRTVFLCEEADMLLLFPSNPIGRGSSLAFKTMLQANKPIFLVQEQEPEESPLYDVYPSNLFGVAQGFWIIPHVYPE
jgi:hypothetical protein